MQLHITHDTRYDYAAQVELAQHIACLRPLHGPTQTLVWHQLSILPQPVQVQDALDVFGNTRSFFAFQAPHQSLLISATSLVNTRPPLQADTQVVWTQVSEQLSYRTGQSYEPASAFVFDSPLVRAHSELRAYAAISFTPGRLLLEASCELMERIHSDFSYESHSTQVDTPLLQAFAQRRGVCQDFAHIMIACLRSLGLAARYVSGYLLTQPPPGQPRLIGSDASHAWVSVYLPDASTDQRWCDFDPTNNRWGVGSPGEDYVTLGVGRDFSDVSPLRGVIHGGSQHSLSVAVTVQPFEQTQPGLFATV